jgi:hypothetical protein
LVGWFDSFGGLAHLKKIATVNVAMSEIVVASPIDSSNSYSYNDV